MQYMLLLFTDEKRWAQLTPEQTAHDYAAYGAYTEAVRKAGAFVEGNQLQPISTGTTVRVNGDGKAAVLDGPYAETKEQLGGYYVIEAANLDEALSWAARCPAAAHGTVEVRPIVERVTA
jgi:hypothetical protein